MCGIYASNLKHLDLQVALSPLVSRGPDELNIVSLNLFGEDFDFAHSLLSVETLGAPVQQPVFTGNGNCFAFNGEIYNYHILSDQFHLGAKSDTEVLRYLIERFGFERSLKFIVGPISIIYFDVYSGKIFFYRDPIGEKPLFFNLIDNKITISSCENIIVKTFQLTRNSRRQKVFTACGFSDFGSIYNGIECCHPGVVYCFDGHSVHRSTLDLIDVDVPSLNLDDIGNSLSELANFIMPSKLKPVLFFSGGADSTSIKNSIGVGKFAKLISLVDEDNSVNVSEPDVLCVKVEYSVDSFVKYLESLSSPLGDPAGIGFHFLATAAKKYSKVAISGDGFDEILESYPKNNLINFIPHKLHPRIFDFIYMRRARSTDSVTISENLEYSNRFDAGLRLPNYLLPRGDLPTMGVGVELRSPFLLWNNFKYFMPHTNIKRKFIKEEMNSKNNYIKKGFPCDLTRLNDCLVEVARHLGVVPEFSRFPLVQYRSNISNCWHRLHAG